MLEVPVVMIAFNRPDHVRRTLERVREAKPIELFLVVDAPRPDRPDDVEPCAAVRRELDAIDWDCKIHRRYAEANLGCEANIELGLDWVFAQVDRAIILEDDCVADPTFFRYCAELLDRHADDDLVWHIAGSTSPVPREFFGDDSYAFSYIGAVWGWASWSRAWKAHRATFSRDHATSANGHTAPPEWTKRPTPARNAVMTGAGHRYFTDVAESTNGNVFGWDSYWWLSTIVHSGLAITPTVNMVENIGFGDGATHTQLDRESPGSEPMAFPLHHPASVALNPSVAREHEMHLARGSGRLARTVGRILGHGRLRKAARRVSTSPVTWRIARAISASSARLRRTTT